MSFIKTFDQVIKHNFDQMPVLLENFDQVIRSSAIRSSDPMSLAANKRWPILLNRASCNNLIIEGRNEKSKVITKCKREIKSRWGIQNSTKN